MTTNEISKNVSDARRFGSHGAVALIGALLGMCGHRAVAPDAPDRDLAVEVSSALDDAQEHWHRALGGAWRDARVVLVDAQERTRCGGTAPAHGPFYCPTDGKIYLDLAFLRAIDGDLARAYVLGHEVAHHVQHLTGSPLRGADAELDADCLAGDWLAGDARASRAEDVDAALAEAVSAGDDALSVSPPEQWAHGTGAQRRAALLRGLRGEGCSP